MLKHPKGKIIVSLTPIERRITSLFLQLPNEYGWSGVMGKRYEAIKDYLGWEGFSLREWVPLMVIMSDVWASSMRKG